MSRPEVALAVICLLGAPALPAAACERQVPQQPGESGARAYQRLKQEDQRQYWAGSDTIFVGRVIGIRESKDGVEATVDPLTPLKGDAPPGAITYLVDGLEITCERASFPEFRSVGVFYGLRRSEGPTVWPMLLPEDIQDRRLRARVTALTTNYQTPPPDSPTWLTLVTLVACLVSYAVGILTGRLSRQLTRPIRRPD